MNTNDFIQLIENQSTVENINLSQLDSVLDNFPYFQSARMLYLKNLKLKKNFQFNSHLKTTAAYVGDRTVLFEYITRKTEKVETIQLKAIETTAKQDEIATAKDLISSTNTEHKGIKKDKETDIETKETHSVIEFSSNDRFSFNEWLQLSNVRQIHRKIDEKIIEKQENSNLNNKNNSSKKSKFDLIDKFIDSNPKLRPVPKNEAISGNIAISGTKENDGWMTETLAQVYIEQKKYSKAIKAYKILGLKYPEKSGFFADRIRSIRKLSEH